MATTPVIEPPQNVPFVDGDDRLFNRTWWLFWFNLSAAINGRGSIVVGNGIISYADGAESIPYPQAIERLNWEKHGERISVLDFGALADLLFGDDGAIASGTRTLASASTVFSSQDIGKAIWIEGAGAAGSADLLATITAVNSTTSVQVSIPASFTVTGASFRFGTDNLEAIQKAFDIAADGPGAQIYFPRGAYGIIGTLAVYNNLALTGEGYTHDPFRPFEAGSPSQLVGLADVPIISHPGTTTTDTLFSFNVEKLTFRGTSRSGSVGIYIGYVFGCLFRDVSFNYFGDQALHIAFGVDGNFDNCFGSDTLLVRTRADYAGGFQIGCSDMQMVACKCTTSVSFPGGVVTGGLFGDGHGAGIMITGGNSFIDDSYAHGSQIGWYITTTGSLTTFTNCRADLNQGEGFIIGPNASYGNFVGCHAHANSLDATLTFSGFRIVGSGNVFTGTLFTSNYDGVHFDAIYNQMLYGFEIETPALSDPNQFWGNYFQNNAISGDGVDDCYHVTAGQDSNPILDATVRDPPFRVTHRCNGDFSIRGEDDKMGLFQINLSATAGVDEKIWTCRPYHKTFRIEAWKDDYSSPIAAIVMERTGTTIDSIALVSPILNMQGDVFISGGQILQFQDTTAKILAGSGSPEGVVTAVGGSLYLDGNGSLWFKDSGVGDTGWAEVGTGSSTLPVVDTTAIVKGSVDATKLLRFEVDGLTTATTRVATMPDRDLTINQLSHLVGVCSADLTCTTSYADVTGMTVTLTQTGDYLITADCEIGLTVAANEVLCQLLVNGVAQTGIVRLLLATGSGTDSLAASVTRTWIYSNSGSNVAKIQGKKTINAGAAMVHLDNSALTAVFLG